jgi:glycosyltransferase involved in cell wall biosynthesis
MRTVGVYAEDYPWDIRIEKILTGLVAHGSSVDLVCRNLKRRPRAKFYDGIRCLRVLPPGLPGIFQSLLSIPAYMNPVWQRAVRRAIQERDPDILIVRDLPLALLAIREAKRFHIPCLVDMAENHPEMWRQVGQNDRWVLPSFFLKNVALAKYLERRVVCEADAIFVVVEEMKEHLVAIGGSTERIFVVSNTPILSDLNEATPVPAMTNLDASTLDLIYTGYITDRRGLELVVRALSVLREMKPIPRLHIVGEGKHLSVLKNLVNAKALQDRVFFHGWIDHKDLPKIMATCDAGIVPHPKNGHTDHTVPNKIFDYMVATLPVVVSNAKPIERIVRETGCGCVFTSGDVHSLAKCILDMGDPNLRSVMGRRGRDAVISRFNWEMDFQKARAALDAVLPS